MTSAIETLDYTPGLAAFTCDGCRSVVAVGTKPLCCVYDRVLKTNEHGQKLRCAECLVGCRGELND